MMLSFILEVLVGSTSERRGHSAAKGLDRRLVKLVPGNRLRTRPRSADVTTENIKPLPPRLVEPAANPAPAAPFASRSLRSREKLSYCKTLLLYRQHAFLNHIFFIKSRNLLSCGFISASGSLRGQSEAYSDVITIG